MLKYVRTYPDGVRLVATLNESSIRIYAEAKSPCYNSTRLSSTIALDVGAYNENEFDRRHAAAINSVPNLLASVRAQIAEERRQIDMITSLVKTLKLTPFVQK